jgi:hypothetical protein
MERSKIEQTAYVIPLFRGENRERFRLSHYPETAQANRIGRRVWAFQPQETWLDHQSPPSSGREFDTGRVEPGFLLYKTNYGPAWSILLNLRCKKFCHAQ